MGTIAQTSKAMKQPYMLAVLCILSALSLGCALPMTTSGLQIQIKFDESIGANKFADSGSFGRHGTCNLGGHSCPTAGASGKHSNSAFFAKHCADPMNTGEPNNRGAMIQQAATCGSRVNFNPVHFKDGTVMLWYKEHGESADENMPQLANAAPAPSRPTDSANVVWRRAKDTGWDLSLVGGNNFFLGRISSNFWGGYFCGQWRTARASGVRGGQSPLVSSADPDLGWNHLEWHHFTAVFSGSTVMIYIDGNRVVVFRNVAQCQKTASFLGERTVRYTAQNGVRETEMTGLTSARPKDSTSGALNHQPSHMNWSTNFFKGWMDDFRIFNTVLTESQISSYKDQA